MPRAFVTVEGETRTAPPPWHRCGGSAGAMKSQVLACGWSPRLRASGPVRVLGHRDVGDPHGSGLTPDNPLNPVRRAKALRPKRVFVPLPVLGQRNFPVQPDAMPVGLADLPDELDTPVRVGSGAESDSVAHAPL